jgi:hypothetical protein
VKNTTTGYNMHTFLYYFNDDVLGCIINGNVYRMAWALTKPFGLLQMFLNN